MRAYFPALCLLLFLSPALKGQNANTPFFNRENTGEAFLVTIQFSGQTTGGDLADRFGPSSDVSASVGWMSEGKSWIFGIEGAFLFGSDVREDVLAPLRTSQGDIIGITGTIAPVLLRQRGFYLGAHAGRIFPLSKSNPRNGIRVSLGGGYLQHQIRIVDDSNTTEHLSGDFQKGYDRLTSGPALRQFVGYQLFSADRLLNFHVGLECTQAFTQSRRTVNYDTGLPGDRNRLDLMFGLRIGWSLPLYYGIPKEETYY